MKANPSKAAELMENNRSEIKQYNRKIASQLLPLTALLTLMPVAVSPFSSGKAAIMPVYLGVFIACTLLYLLFRFTPLYQYPLVVLYLCGAIFFSMGIFLSVINSPTQRASILLGLFCAVPLSIVDRRRNLAVFSGFFFLLHTALSFWLKGTMLGFDDLVNCFCMMVLGLFTGSMLYRIRLEFFEAQRQLIKEKKTDVLTGLANRRNLFEMLTALEDNPQNVPTGVLMLDIDHFKQFNDSYGHAAGDECLKHFGALLREFEHLYSICFYRYGGEEFVALVWDCDEKELVHIAESIRVATQKRHMGAAQITVSIGAATCNREENKNFEFWIGLADTAAYLAKKNGRNRVELYQKEEVMPC